MCWHHQSNKQSQCRTDVEVWIKAIVSYLWKWKLKDSKTAVCLAKWLDWMTRKKLRTSEVNMRGVSTECETEWDCEDTEAEGEKCKTGETE
jgi:hypothetical protein